MGKVGALNDLLRGIKKILPKSATISPDSGVSSYSVSSLLDRGYLFLEDEEWDKADAIFERVLDLEPRNPNAYLGKMLIQSGCKNLEELLQSPIVNNGERAKYYVENNHPAIIDRAIVGKVQEEIARRSGLRKVKQVGIKNELGKYSSK